MGGAQLCRSADRLSPGIVKNRWQQVDQLFHSALEHEPSQRSAFLGQACNGDEMLRNEVESLLASHEQAGSFIEAPAADVAADLLADNRTRLAAGRTLGPYKIVDLLGTGGMGEVYLAQDTRLGRKIALKLLPAQFIKDEDRLHRFEREARSASALNHPNIVTIHEIGKVDGAHFIITEFIEGKTLRQHMADKMMKLREALDVAIQIAGALAAAHKAGIVHRDIKPENIMLRPDGLAKVLDFGLAKLTEPQTPVTEDEALTVARIKTESGLVIGTVRYMSPEQARGLAVDARTDIFSVGVVLYEMIAGRSPFEGSTTSDMIAAILREEPTPLSQYSREAPPELDWIVLKTLAKDREERYQTIKELHIDLKRLRQELESQAKLEGMATATRSAGGSVPAITISSEAGVARRDAGGESLLGEIQRHKRGRVLSSRTLLVGVAIIGIFSLASFYAGLKQVVAPSPPTFRQLTLRRGLITAARFAPDGNTIIYSATFDGKPVELFTSRLESPESSSLKAQVGGRVAGIQSISPTGEMAVLLDCELIWGVCHNGTLVRMPLVGGTPRVLMDDVFEADWSPDGKNLAIIHGVEGQFQLEYPIRKVLYKAPGWIEKVRVSPKGDMVAFIDHPVLGDVGGSIMVVDLTGKTTTLSAGWTTAKALAWFPTGDEVWFCAGKNRAEALHAVTTSGQERLVFQAIGVVQLHDISHDGRILLSSGNPRSRMMSFTSGAEKERDLSWFDFSTAADLSNDGKNLLFYEWGAAAGRSPLVYLRKMDGSNDPIRLGDGKALALSPDGKWALALREGPPPQLVMLPTGAGEPRLLPRGNISEYHYASWFPDGERILFTGLESGHPLRSYVQNISTGEVRQVTEEGMIALLVSPDAKNLVGWVPDKGPDGKYYLCPLNGATPTPISGLGLGEVPIQWSADGRALYVREGGDVDAAIYRVDLSGRRTLVKKIVPDPVGLIGIEVRGPGGIQITPDGKSYVYTYWTTLQDLVLIEGLK